MLLYFDDDKFMISNLELSDAKIIEVTTPTLWTKDQN